MPVPIISASGNAYGMIVNPDGSINVNAFSAPNSYNSQTVIQYVGSEIGSVYACTLIGSYLKVLTYDAGSSIIDVSAWVVI